MFNGYIENNKRQTPQYSIFKCGLTHLNFSLEILGKTFNLQKEFLETEMNHGEIYADTWRDKRNEWLDYVNNDVLCTVFSYARYIKAMQKITRFGLKDCLCSPGLRWKYFNSLRTTEEDEPIYTFIEKCMRWFVRKSIKGGRACAVSQYCK